MSIAHGILFFAQTEYTAPDGYTHFIECAFYTTGFIAMAVLAFRAIFPTKDKKEKMPQPLVTREHQDFVTTEQHAADLAAVDHRINKLHQDAVDGRRNLHNHLDQLRKDMHAEIEQMPAKIIRLLRDTKDLL